MGDEALREAFATDVVLLKYVGLNPIVVHGGGPDITDYMRRLGMEVKFVEGLRVTDEGTREIAQMVLLGKVNSDIVRRLNRHGQPAVGLSGEDGTLFEVTPVANAEEVGFVGEIERVDVDVLNHIAEDFIPVIASIGVDREGRSYNINADEAAGKVAANLAAHKLIFLTDVEGWLADPDDPGSRISRATVAEIERELPRRRRRDGSEAARLRRRDPRRRPVRAHHRRPPAALAAARAVHRRGHRDDGHAMSVAELQPARGALGDADLQAGPGRVRARRGLAALGRRRQAVPRLLRRPLGPQRRQLPPARSSRRSASRPGARWAPRTSTTASPACGSRSGSRTRASAGRSS